jgi:hypothetical protein
MKDFENYDKYAKLTLSKDLSGICQLNGVDLDSFVELKKGSPLEQSLNTEVT